MKIFFDYKIFQQEYGGPSRYFFELFEALLKINKEAFILSPIYLNKYLQNSNFPKNIIGKKIESNSFISKFFKMINQNSSRIICTTNKPDIIHTTYYENFIISKKKPIIVTVHDLIHEIFYYEFGMSKDYRPKKQILNYADKIICVSNSTKKDLINIYNIDENKISVIYHGKPKINLVSENNLNQKKPFFLYVGNRKRYKNFEIIIDAFMSEKIINNNFDLICFGGGKFLKSEIDLLEKKKFKINQIKQISGDDDKLQKLYEKAEALIYPSLYEGFGMPLIEAMTFGCPVISSNTSSLPEIYGNASMSFNPKSGEELAHCMKKLVEDKNIREDLKKKGFTQSNKFSWNKCAEETFKVYSSCL